jgi:hypothetical protein
MDCNQIRAFLAVVVLLIVGAIELSGGRQQAPIPKKAVVHAEAGDSGRRFF